MRHHRRHLPTKVASPHLTGQASLLPNPNSQDERERVQPNHNGSVMPSTGRITYCCLCRRAGMSLGSSKRGAAIRSRSGSRR